MKKILDRFSIVQLIFLGFLSVILIGSFLLWLPMSSQDGTFTHYIDALFTATSAVCVTGQVTLNTAMHWSYIGKTIIIILIEIGGLGFMSLIVIMFLVIGKKINIRQRKLIQESLNLSSVHEAKHLIKYVILFSMSVQLGGALILMIDFIPRYGIFKGIYFGLFHAISAFCNAGFDLFGDSLIGFQTNPLVLLTISSLIIIGGLGFIVWRDLLTFRKNHKLLIHTKIILTITAILLGGSFILFTFSEGKNGTFANISDGNRFINYWFMTVTPRTAGYANIDYTQVSLFGIFLTIVLMFIGGSAGSTAGGVKTSTIAVTYLYIRSMIQGKPTTIFHRSIPKQSIIKALTVIVIGISVITLATFLLLASETIPEGFGIEYILVEVFSCFGTVGLTMGLTPDLTEFGKIVLILLMFMGRIGLLTFFMSFKNKDKDSHIEYPEERILIG